MSAQEMRKLMEAVNKKPMSEFDLKKKQVRDALRDSGYQPKFGAKIKNGYSYKVSEWFWKKEKAAELRDKLSSVLDHLPFVEVKLTKSRMNAERGVWGTGSKDEPQTYNVSIKVLENV